MDRRRFLLTMLGGTLAAPPAAPAQPRRAIIGVLHVSAVADAPAFPAFRDGLRDLGYVEGKNVVLDYRWPHDRPEQLSSLAAALVQSKVDIIVAGDPTTALAAKRATTEIPIVVAVLAIDPVKAGLVTSLARPGGNLTGLTALAPEMSRKRLEFLAEAVPGLKRLAVLWNPHAVQHAALVRETDEAARDLDITVVRIAASGIDDIDTAFQTAAKERAAGVSVLQAAEFSRIRGRIGKLGLAYRLPTISGEPGFIEAGGLMTYGPSIPDLWRRAAIYADKILKGAKPADLPIEQPTKFTLAINLKTAKALGLTIPPSLLLRADQVIDQ
jgi:putative tryptophan/tyrosine transport system substrate-binding protein